MTTLTMTDSLRLPVLTRCGLALQLISLALMVGGMLALGAFTAPLVFGQLPKADAAHVMGMIFKRYDVVLLFALGALWLGEALRCFGGAGRTITGQTRPGVIWMLRVILLLALTGTLLYAIVHVNPQIERFQEAGLHRTALTAEGLKFESVHRLSESLYKADMVMALLILILTPFTLFHPLLNWVAKRTDSTGTHAVSSGVVAENVP